MKGKGESSLSYLRTNIKVLPNMNTLEFLTTFYGESALGDLVVFAKPSNKSYWFPTGRWETAANFTRSLIKTRNLYFGDAPSAARMAEAYARIFSASTAESFSRRDGSTLLKGIPLAFLTLSNSRRVTTEKCGH